ncbi:MAG: TraM recognition domain-containing protein [Desulfovibrio sp.]|nr:TraM recognition domain-containing protein [Desulfovibrio sp.]
MRSLYGLHEQQEVRKERFLRDITSPVSRTLCGITGRLGFSFIAVACLGGLWLHPGLWPLWLCVYACCAALRWHEGVHAHLPMRMPKDHGGLDYNSPKPGGGYTKASGMLYLGNSLGEDNAQLWISAEDMLTHMLVLGTTGSGKTETLVSLCCNYLAMGSGVIYVDPKAAPKLGVQLWTMARMLGRDDDFLLINYMAEKNGQTQAAANRQTNTQNPFAVGDANSLTQLLFALMPADPGGGSIFASTAQTLISGLLFVLVERRDMGLEVLSIETIRAYLMDVQKIDALAREQCYSETAHLALVAALSTVGWDPSRDCAHQQKHFFEQYAYARAYFGRALSLLVDNYGRIFRVSHGEVDAVDVITNRRILVTLIPSMDKDPKELRCLGQICLASVRNACAVGLGTRVQGDVATVLGSLPTASKIPFGIIVDEYAAIETPGFEILLTQGRGLGMAVTVASQDFAGIQRASQAAAEQIVSNCKVKLFMTTEDPKQTTDLIKKLAGTGYATSTTGYERPRSSEGGTYVERGVRPERFERVDFRDLQTQIEGDVTISFKGRIIRGRTFYANPTLHSWLRIRLAYQLQLVLPDSRELDSLFGRLHTLFLAYRARIKDGKILEKSPSVEDPVLTQLGAWMNKKKRWYASDWGIATLCQVRSEENACPSGDKAEKTKEPSLLPSLPQEKKTKERSDDIGNLASLYK